VAAAKKIFILDDDGKKIGERFEVTDEFVVSVGKNYVEMKDSNGRVIRANRKLLGEFVDRGGKAPTEEGTA
jgi:hypothetical protein